MKSKALTSPPKPIEGEYIAAGEDADLPPEGLQPRRCECGNERAEQFGLDADGGGSLDSPRCRIRMHCMACDKRGPYVSASFLPWDGPSMEDRKHACAAWNEQRSEVIEETVGERPRLPAP